MQKLLNLAILMLVVTFHTFSQKVEVYNIVPSKCKTGDQCLIEIDIDKWDISGLARLHHTIPENVTVEVINDAGADVIIDNSRITFIWIRLPDKKELTPSYQLRFSAHMKGKVEVGEGEFSYIVENKIQKIYLKPTLLYINTAPPPEPTAIKEESNDKQKEDLPESAQKESISVEEKALSKEVVEQTLLEGEREDKEEKAKGKEEKPEREAEKIEIQTDDNDKSDDIAIKNKKSITEKVDIKEKKLEREPEEIKEHKVSTTDEKHSGEYFRVQFSALRNYTDKESLKKTFGIDEKVYHEFDDQWHRYTFGHYKTRPEASAAAKTFSERTGRSTFVVRYKDGKRI